MTYKLIRTEQACDEALDRVDVLMDLDPKMYPEDIN